MMLEEANMYQIAGEERAGGMRVGNQPVGWSGGENKEVWLQKSVICQRSWGGQRKSEIYWQRDRLQVTTVKHKPCYSANGKQREQVTTCKRNGGNLGVYS